MPKLNSNQIFVILILSFVPLSFFITPKILTKTFAHMAWLSLPATLIPGSLLILIYIYILKKSSSPFPILLQEHLGTVVGKILGFGYIVVFLFGTILHLGLFAHFMNNNVIATLPITILIGSMLAVSFYALLKGIEVSSRVFEIIFVVGILLTIIFIVMSYTVNPNIANLQPIRITNYNHAFKALFQSFWMFGNTMIVLTMAYFSNDRYLMPKILFAVLFFYIFIIMNAVLVTVINLGNDLNITLAFPLFSIVRSITIGKYIRNIEIIIISTFIIGIFSSMTIQWFMLCFTIDKTFDFKDYRFLLIPLALIIGFSTMLISPNLITLYLIWEKKASIIFTIAYIIMPILLAIWLIFKPYPSAEQGNGLNAPVNEQQQ